MEGCLNPHPTKPDPYPLLLFSLPPSCLSCTNSPSCCLPPHHVLPCCLPPISVSAQATSCIPFPCLYFTPAASLSPTLACNPSCLPFTLCCSSEAVSNSSSPGLAQPSLGEGAAAPSLGLEGLELDQKWEGTAGRGGKAAWCPTSHTSGSSLFPPPHPTIFLCFPVCKPPTLSNVLS